MPAHAADTGSAGGLLTIDLAALRANYRLLARWADPARCAAVVKADAYGIGAGRAAPILYAEGCRHFFVAHLSEGLALRPLLPADAMIAILNGLQPGGEMACVDGDLLPVLNGMDQVRAWARLAAGLGRHLPAALQVDTGMSRLGLPESEVDEFLADDGLRERIDVRLVMSHLACADEPDHPANASQLDCLSRLLSRLPPACGSFANSGGILLESRYHHDLARAGLALYGVSPTPGHGAGLRPVVSLQARVIQVRAIQAGTSVGYGASFVAPRAMRIATVGVGYADGWPRWLGDVSAAFAGETRLPIVGRVSMDSMTIDVGALADGALRLGSLVELIGPHQTIDDVALQAGTIPYEILTSLGRRYDRRYLDDHAGDARLRQGPETAA